MNTSSAQHLTLITHHNLVKFNILFNAHLYLLEVFLSILLAIQAIYYLKYFMRMSPKNVLVLAKLVLCILFTRFLLEEQI